VLSVLSYPYGREYYERNHTHAGRRVGWGRSGSAVFTKIERMNSALNFFHLHMYDYLCMDDTYRYSEQAV
jgi:hypothetical protein